MRRATSQAPSGNVEQEKRDAPRRPVIHAGLAMCIGLRQRPTQLARYAISHSRLPAMGGRDYRR